MSDFRFADIHLVHGIWLVAGFLALILILERRGGHALENFLSRTMQTRLVFRPHRTRRTLSTALLGVAGICLVGALMRPQWGLTFEKTPRAGAELMVCLDVSKSMLAEDVAPNRLERAKAEIRDLLPFLEGDHVGLIAFAGRATVLCPMTPDFSFLRLVLDEASPRSVNRGGTNLSAPIDKAIAGFGDTSDVSRAIVLITDGEDHDTFPEDAAKRAMERGIKIISIGFGDEAGSDIPYTDPETGARTLVRDADGNVVRTRLDGELLREMTDITDGAYVPAGTGVLDLESIYNTHVAALTRGKLDGRGRSSRKEGFQWAVLLGLAFLVASVALSTAGRETRAVSRVPSGHPTPGTLVLAWVLSGVWLLSSPLPAQEPPPAPRPAESPDAPAPSEESVAGGESPAPGATIPEDAREAHNQGLTHLDGGDLAAAERYLAAARQNAGSDSEVRYRATFNLGWVDVKRADEKLAEEPQEALTYLNSAAAWFQDAVRLRPSEQGPRQNLELVRRRALELKDSLAQRNPRELETRLDDLIEAQRALGGEVAGAVESFQALEDPTVPDEMRREFRNLATAQRTILSDVGKVVEDVGQERDALNAKAEEERSPEEQMRCAQLDAVLHYLHRTRERLGQSRRHLKRSQGKRSYRRASAGLTELKRARDQLRDPVALLSVLIADAAEAYRFTAIRAAAERPDGAEPPVTGPSPAPPSPPWLTMDFLRESLEGITERTEEIRARVEAGLEKTDVEDPVVDPQREPGPTAEDPAQRERFLRALREGLPHLSEARDAFDEATSRLADEGSADALALEERGILALAAARELFLDLKGLVELVYRDERRIALALAEELPEDGLNDLVAQLRPLQKKNLGRCDRLRALIEEAVAQLPEADPQVGNPGANDAPPDAERAQMERQRLELARDLLAAARTELLSVQNGLGASDTTTPRSPDLAGARNAVERAIPHLESLRRLFFSIVEHLRETAERQAKLNDETQDVVPLASTDPDQVAPKLGPLGVRQEELTNLSQEIGGALRQLSENAPAEAMGAAPDENPGGKAAAEETSRRFAAAANLVLEARDAMDTALAGMKSTETPPKLEAVREQQDRALAKLAEALQLLVPPEERDRQQQQQEQQQQAQQSQPEPQENPQNDEEKNMDPAQLLQAVRDREAKRRQEKEQQRTARYEPVEKDW